MGAGTGQFQDLPAMDTMVKGSRNTVRKAADTQGTIWVSVLGNPLQVMVAPVAAALLGNADVTIQVTGGSEYAVPKNTLTGNHSVQLGTTGAVAGDVIRIVRLDKTANTISVVNGGPASGVLLTMPVSAGRIADFVFDGTNWALSGFVRLA